VIEDIAVAPYGVPVDRHSVRTSEAPDPLLGRILEDRYHVLQCIGRGGMGAVYLAEHVLIRRKVAIKTLHAPLADSAESIGRFHREAVAAAAIGNEHVVDVTDMGQLENGAYYIVLEYLEGADLDWRVVHDGRLSVARSLRIVLQLCDALEAVHAAGIVHRDLKPENLFLIERGGNSDFLKVLDFGVCKFRDAGAAGDRRLTATGAAVGTPHYMAPEQIEGRTDIDQRADIYAVGGILHFALTGEPPFDAPTLPRLFMRICQDPPPHLRASRPEVSRRLERVLARALAKNAQDRFADAGELRQALLPLLAAADEEERRRARPGAVRTRSAPLERSGVRESAVGQGKLGTDAGRTPTTAIGSSADAVRTPTTATGSSAASGHAASRGESARALPGRRRWPLWAAVAVLVPLAVLGAWSTMSVGNEPGRTPSAARPVSSTAPISAAPVGGARRTMATAAPEQPTVESPVVAPDVADVAPQRSLAAGGVENLAHEGSSRASPRRGSMRKSIARQRGTRAASRPAPSEDSIVPAHVTAPLVVVPLANAASTEPVAAPPPMAPQLPRESDPEVPRGELKHVF
jgi:serine/threonine-protein kinase